MDEIDLKDTWHWKCDVCHKMRPDKFISVSSQDVSLRHRVAPGTMHVNIKYCNDNTQCVFTATRPDFEPDWWKSGWKSDLLPYTHKVPDRQLVMLVVGILIILLVLSLVIPLYK